MKGIHIVLIVGIIAAAVLIGISMTNDDTVGDKIDSAINKVEDATNPDDTPGEKVGEAIKDAGEAVKDAAD